MRGIFSHKLNFPIVLVLAFAALFLTGCGDFLEYSAENEESSSADGNGKVPTAPKSITASAESSSVITVSWSSVSGATGYSVYRSLNASNDFYNIGSESSTSYTDTGLSESTTYYYKVTAHNSNGESPQSVYVRTTTLEYTGPGSVYDPIPLSEDAWVNDNNYSGGATVWYSFDVTGETTYYIWWNDSNDGDYTKYLNVKVSAWYSDGTNIFLDEDAGWTNPQSFTADSSDTVKIKVEPYSGNTGSFALVYSASNTRPDNGVMGAPTSVTATAASSSSITVNWTSVSGANGYHIYRGSSVTGPFSQVGGTTTLSYTDTGLTASTTYYYKVAPYNDNGEGSEYGYTSAITLSSGGGGGGGGIGDGTEGNPIQLTAGIWANGSITSSASGSAVWYSISVTQGTIYYMWWNDSHDGDYTKTLDVKVSATHSNGTTALSTTDSGWSYSRLYAANSSTSSGTVKIKVEPWRSGDTGTFAIVYNTIDTRPGGSNDPGTEGNPHALASESWTDGSITSGVSAVYYRFNANSGTTYYVWWNDTDANLNKTLNAKVSAYYSGGGPSFFTNMDVSWSTPQSFTPNSSGTVILKVEPLNSGSTGTFAITYRTSASRPNTSPPATPTGFSATSEASSSVYLSWYSASNATGYYIYRSESVNGTYNRVGNTSSSPYTDTGLSASTTYYYKITAYNSFGESSQTGYISVTTLSRSGSGTFSNPYALSGGFRDGEITASDREIYYSYTCTNVLGTCTISWNDSDNSAKTADVKVTAYWSGSNEIIFQDADSGPRSFSAKMGTVMIIVEPVSSSSTGTFSIRCSFSF